MIVRHYNILFFALLLLSYSYSNKPDHTSYYFVSHSHSLTAYYDTALYCQHHVLKTICIIPVTRKRKRKRWNIRPSHPPKQSSSCFILLRKPLSSTIILLLLIVFIPNVNAHHGTNAPTLFVFYKFL